MKYWLHSSVKKSQLEMSFFNYIHSINENEISRKFRWVSDTFFYFRLVFFQFLPPLHFPHFSTLSLHQWGRIVFFCLLIFCNWKNHKNFKEQCASSLMWWVELLRHFLQSRGVMYTGFVPAGYGKNASRQRSYRYYVTVIFECCFTPTRIVYHGEK